MLTTNFNMFQPMFKMVKNTHGDIIDKHDLLHKPNWANLKNYEDGGVSFPETCAFPCHYAITTGANTYTDEQTAYDWLNVITNSTSSERYQSRMRAYLTLFVGSGTTPPTVNDYKLSSPLNLQVENGSCVINTNTTKVSTLRTFTNNKESQVIISEIGLYVCSSGTGNTSYPVLIGRSILSNPKVLEVGESATLTYELDYANQMIS